MDRKTSGTTDLPVGTAYLLKRTELAVRGCLETTLAEMSLTPSQFSILLLVTFGEATSSAELARAIGVLPQSMTELIASLEKNGTIVRKRDPRNNRILRIALTPAGKRLFAKASELAIRLEQELLAGLDPRDVAHLNRMFCELTARAEAHLSHPKLRQLTKSSTKPKAARASGKAPASRRSGTR